MKCKRRILYLSFICSSSALAQINHSTQIVDSDSNQNVVGQNEKINEYFETDENLISITPKLYAQAEDASGKPPGEASPSTATLPKDTQIKDSSGTTTGTVSDPGKAKKKKGTKKLSGDASDPAGHGAQEAGGPYKANIGASFEYSSESKSKKYSDKTSKFTSTSMSLGLEYLMIFGKFEVGPQILYSTETSKSPDSIDGQFVKDTSTTTGLGGMGVFNFGNIQQDKMVPYGATSILRTSTVISQTSESSASTTKSTTNLTLLSPEFGVKFFLGAHLAVNPYFKYILEMSGDEKIEQPGNDATVAAITGSKMALGFGLLTYF